MAISLSSEQKKESFKITTKVFWNLIALLGVVILIFVFLLIYNAALNAKIEDTRAKIKAIDDQRDGNIEKEMKGTLDAYKKIYPVLSSHTRASKILDFVENNAYEGVTFSNLIYNRKENSISLNATSDMASNLSMQLAVFKTAKGVQNMEVSGFTMSEKTISLQINITIDPSVSIF